MFLKIENELGDSDYVKLAEVLESGTVDSIALFRGFFYESVQVTELTIAAWETGYAISTRISFHDPIGNTVCSDVGIKEHGLKKSPMHLELNIEREIITPEGLIADIEYSLLLIEKVINYACKMHGEHIPEMFLLDSSSINQQIVKSVSEKGRQLRGEKIEPFGVIHADSGFDLNTLSNDLVPIYKGYDRWDLYGGQKIYQLLPRDFVRRLLRCQGPDLIPEDQFSEKEREVLRDLTTKHYIQYKRIAGKGYYFNLKRKTVTYLNNALWKKRF